MKGVFIRRPTGGRCERSRGGEEVRRRGSWRKTELQHGEASGRERDEVSEEEEEEGKKGER